MGKSLVEMAAEIVQSQAASKNMTTEELAHALQNTFKTLLSLQSDEVRCLGGSEEGCMGSEGDFKKIDIMPDKSILKNKIICLECGQEFKMLSPKHLRSHSLTSKEYRQKYGFALRQPLCAKTLSDRRKKAGKERGLPENLKKSIADRKKKKPAVKKKTE